MPGLIYGHACLFQNKIVVIQKEKVQDFDKFSVTDSTLNEGTNSLIS